MVAHANSQRIRAQDKKRKEEKICKKMNIKYFMYNRILLESALKNTIVVWYVLQMKCRQLESTYY